MFKGRNVYHSLECMMFPNPFVVVLHNLTGPDIHLLLRKIYCRCLFCFVLIQISKFSLRELG
jgi:hypothetical protein